MGQRGGAGRGDKTATDAGARRGSQTREWHKALGQELTDETLFTGTAQMIGMLQQISTWIGVAFDYRTTADA